MRKEFYMVNIGILNIDEYCFYDLKANNTSHVLFDNYIDSQKFIFEIIDKYDLINLDNYNERVMIWLDIHSEFNESRNINFNTTYDNSYFYYYQGIKDIGSKVFLDPKIKDEELTEEIRHYIPKNRENEYKQAIMEYKLMNK